MIFEVARSGGFCLMPVGCGTLLVDEAMRVHLPDEVPGPVVVVGSGAVVIAAISAAG